MKNKEKKWNLQDIQPVAPRRRRAPSRERPLEKVPAKRKINENNDGTVRIGIEDGNAKKRSHLILAFVIFFAVIGVGFTISFLTGGVDMTVYPKNSTPNVNATFTAYNKPQVGELSYEIMTLESEGERQVSATGKEKVSVQATGEILIFNDTKNPERLKKNTRFETPDGLIFKISESVVVPGARNNSDGENISGSIRANVFADGTGEQYNIGTTHMKVPGYKEGGYTKLYDSVYAENPSAMTGGFEGTKFIIDEKELATEKQKLQTELRNSLIDRVAVEKPAGFVVFDDATTFTYQTLPAVEYGEDLATLKEKALLQIPIFKKEEFADFLAVATIPGYENEPVRIDDYSVLKFSYTTSTTTSTDIGNLKSFSFNLTGKPLIIWKYDEGKLKTDILGKSKTALLTVLGGYPSINKAEAKVRPFWKRSFPDKLKDIRVHEVIE